jgi:hypothetical protein
VAELRCEWWTCNKRCEVSMAQEGSYIELVVCITAPVNPHILRGGGLIVSWVWYLHCPCACQHCCCCCCYSLAMPYTLVLSPNAIQALAFEMKA